MEKAALKLPINKVGSFFKKLHWKELLALLFILVALYFFRQQRKELTDLGASLKNTDPIWLTIGIAGTVVYILLQAALYVYSFYAVKGNISWMNAIELFLKRNVIAVFLPAGGITALAYLPASIRKAQVHKQQVHQASVIYGFIGIFSVFIVAVPVLLYLSLQKNPVPGTTSGLITIVAMLTAMVLFVRSVQVKGRLYQWIIKGRPKVEAKLNEVFSFELVMKQFWMATLMSVFIEFIGIIHLYISMLASGAAFSLEASITGYIVATIFLIISPFLRGMGAIELSLTFILQRYGFTTLQAVEITLLFRFFEFWLPLLAGLISYAAKGKQLFLRLLPPVLIFFLGFINLFSVLTPPIAARLKALRAFIPIAGIEASNFLIIIIGITFIIIAAYLIKGLRSAWVLAFALSVISCLGHLSKALDYEEAILSLLVATVLLLTRKQYRVKSNKKLLNIGIATGLGTFAAALIFGSIGFYYLDVRHFNINFTWKQSLYYAFHEFVLIGNAELKPLTTFGRDFVFFINALGVFAWGFLLYCLVKPFKRRPSSEARELEEARFLLNQYGDSPLDYFKISHDKLLYLSSKHPGFISYRVSGDVAVALEEPVCSEECKVALLKEFEDFAAQKGYNTIYYCVDEDSFYYFDRLDKKKVFIGREGVLDISSFNLEDKGREPLRNALNSLTKKGFATQVHKAPLNGSLIQKLEQVSHEWLEAFNMEEIVFSQGLFDRDEIKNHNVITLSDEEERIVAFLNIIPDYTPEECAFDLIRKTVDAPEAAMDCLIVRLIEYAKEKGYQFLNLGMVPASEIDKPGNAAEEVVSSAQRQPKRINNYQELHDFKEEYATKWLNKYLVYDNNFDLVQLPAVLNKVMQPD